jgi:N utilization substance protein A
MVENQPMKNEFELAFNEIRNQRSLPQEIVLEALRTALISAYRRYSGASAAQMVDAAINPVTGRTKILVEKEVVDEVFSPLTEVTLEKARFYEPEAQLNDTVMVQVEGTTRQFGRIAAQTAKQVILQKIREAERDNLYEEFSDREGDIITGTVQNVNTSVVTVSLGRAEAVMPRSHQIPGERHRQHDKVRVYLVEVKRTNKGPQIVVSRSHRNMLKRLLEFEVPEIYNGQIEIKSIAREAGYRSKVAVFALQDGIDPVGACVGMRGMRIQNIVRELHEEKIDVIEWQSDQKQFISRALSPARVTGVYLEDDPESGRTAVVIVPDDQLSLAIGREGQNARLAAKLTGWRIDIKSVSEAVSDVLGNLDKPLFADLYQQHPALIEDAQRTMAKRDENRTVMPEEFTSLNELANLAETALSEMREEARQERLAEIEAVKSTVPEILFETPIEQLNASQHIVAKLETLENVGEVMWRFLIDERHISRMLRGLPISAFESVKEALDEIMMSAMTGELRVDNAAEVVVEDAQPEPESEVAEAEPQATDSTIEDTQPELEPAVTKPVAQESVIEEEPDELPAAFPTDIPGLEDVPESPAVIATPPKRTQREEPETELGFDNDDEFEEGEFDEEQRGRKQGKKKRRQLVFDEDSGRVVSKRKRKGNRSRDNWEDYLG